MKIPMDCIDTTQTKERMSRSRKHRSPNKIDKRHRRSSDKHVLSDTLKSLTKTDRRSDVSRMLDNVTTDPKEWWKSFAEIREKANELRDLANPEQARARMQLRYAKARAARVDGPIECAFCGAYLVKKVWHEVTCSDTCTEKFNVAMSSRVVTNWRVNLMR